MQTRITDIPIHSHAQKIGALPDNSDILNLAEITSTYLHEYSVEVSLNTKNHLHVIAHFRSIIFYFDYLHVRCYYGVNTQFV